MIKKKTVLHVVDNSGAKKAVCIGISTSQKKKSAAQGDLIVVSVSKLRNKARKIAKVTKGSLEKACVVRVKRNTFNRDGFYHSFDKNSCFLISSIKTPIGSRLFGVLPGSAASFYKASKSSDFIV